MEYIRDESYLKLDKNNKQKAREKMSVSDIVALANAHRIAEERGIFPKGLGTLFLSNAMVENHPENYGVTKRYEPTGPARWSKDRLSKVESMGLQDVLYKNQKSHGLLPLIESEAFPLSDDDRNTNARLAAYIFSDKRLDPYRWNGRGPDARRHAARVRTMERMNKTNPENKQIVDIYNQARIGRFAYP